MKLLCLSLLWITICAMQEGKNAECTTISISLHPMPVNMTFELRINTFNTRKIHNLNWIISLRVCIVNVYVLCMFGEATCQTNKQTKIGPFIHFPGASSLNLRGLWHFCNAFKSILAIFFSRSVNALIAFPPSQLSLKWEDDGWHYI